MIVKPTVSRFHGLALAPAMPAKGSPYRKCSSLSALPKSCADLNRSAGSFSKAFRTAASTFAGMEARCLTADTGSPAMILPSTA